MDISRVVTNLRKAKRYFPLFLFLFIVIYYVYGKSKQDCLMLQTSQRGSSSPSSSLSSLPSSSSSSSSSSAKSSRQQQRQLLLVTKPRSGSSFTSELIANHSSVFYVFEPLTTVSSKTFIDKSDWIRDKVQKVLSAFFSCDFTDVSANVLNYGFLGRTQAGSLFRKCQLEKTNGYAHIDCLNDFVKSCRSSDVVFLKIVRPPLSWMKDLLQDFPNLKIMYLIRDPRAELFSRSFGHNSIKWNNLKEDVAARHCDDLSEDIDTITQFKNLFPGRVKLIRYESGVIDPEVYTENIYKFAGFEFSKGTLENISKNQGNSKSKRRSRMVTSKGNATKSLYKWRHSPHSYRASAIIDQCCKKFYDKVGYFKVTSEKEMDSEQNTFFMESEQFLKLSERLGA